MRRAVLVTFLVLLTAGQLAVGMRASRNASVTGDEPFYLLTMQSLVSDGDLDLRDEYANGEEREFWDGRTELWKQMEPAPDGRLLAPHDPGLPLVLAPSYALAGLRGAQRTQVVLWAAAMAMACALALRLGARPFFAAGAAIVVGAGAPGIVYASQIYPEGPAALGIACALLVATSERAKPVAMAACAIALAWLGVKYAPAAALVAGVWAWRFRDDGRALVTAGAIALAAGAHFVWWHVETFGGLTPYGTNVVWAGEGTSSILAAHLDLGGRTYRLYGLFLDARFGLFRWLPMAVLGALGIARRTALHVSVLAVFVLMGTFASITIMGWWFPGRMLVAGFPALVVLLAAGAARAPKLAAVLGAWSLAIGAAVAWSATHGGIRLAVDPFTLGAPLAPGWLFPDFRTFGWSQAALSLAWLATLLALRLTFGHLDGWTSGQSSKSGSGGRGAWVGAGVRRVARR